MFSAAVSAFRFSLRGIILSENVEDFKVSYENEKLFDKFSTIVFFWLIPFGTLLRFFLSFLVSTAGVLLILGGRRVHHPAEAGVHVVCQILEDSPKEDLKQKLNLNKLCLYQDLLLR